MKTKIIFCLAILFAQISFSQDYLRISEAKLNEVLREGENYFLNFQDDDFELKYYKKRVILKTTLPVLSKKRAHKKRMKHLLAVFKNHPKIDYEESEEYTDEEYLHSFTAGIDIRISLSEIKLPKSKKGKGTSVEITWYKDFSNAMMPYLTEKDLSKTLNGAKLAETEFLLSFLFTKMIHDVSGRYKFNSVTTQVYPFSKQETIVVHHPYTKEVLFTFEKVEGTNFYASKINAKTKAQLALLFDLEEYYTKKNYRAQLYYPYNLKRCGNYKEQGEEKCLLAQHRADKSIQATIRLFQVEEKGDWYLAIGPGGSDEINNNLSFQERKKERAKDQLKRLAKVIEADNKVILNQGTFPKDKKSITVRIKSSYPIIYIMGLATKGNCQFKAASSSYSEWETGNAFINREGELIKEMESETTTIGGNFRMLPKNKLPAKFNAFESIGIIGMDIAKDNRRDYSSYYIDVELSRDNCGSDAHYFVYTFE